MGQNPLGFFTKAIAGGFGNGINDAQNSLWTNFRHGRNYAASYNGSVGIAANPSGVTTSAGLATTAVGLILSNPITSTVNLAILNVSGSFIVAPTTVTGINLAVGYNATTNVTHTTALTPFNAKVGSGIALQGLADSSATLPTAPVYAMPLAQTLVATDLPSFNIDIGGTIILPPGAYASLATTIASPASGFQGGFVWEENPL